MINQIHCGLTVNPDATLPDGSQEIGIRDLLSGRYPIKIVCQQLIFKQKRGRLQKMEPERRWSLPDRDSAPLLAELFEIIRTKKRFGTVVSVLAPWPDDNTLSKGEGYVRRIIEADKHILSDFFCIYFYECPYFQVDRIVADQISDNRIYIRYNANYRYQRAFVEALIAACDVCYSHSVLRIIPSASERQERWLNLFNGNVRHLLDVHGAVVEESLLIGKKNDAGWIKKAEELYFENMEGAVVVTESMHRYFAEKYNCDAPFFLMPFLSENIAADEDENIEKSGPLTIVYAGGCQTWQNIPLMQQAVKRQIRIADYLMFVSEPEIFSEIWGEESIPKNVVVKTGEPEEILKAYRKAHYGFILRDDSIINRVACPAKIVEYIQFGIVPIMKFAEIGDFKALGLKYWPVEKFSNGELPQEEERMQMAESNLNIIRSQKIVYSRAVEEIRDFIEHLNV